MNRLIINIIQPKQNKSSDTFKLVPYMSISHLCEPNRKGKKKKKEMDPQASQKEISTFERGKLS